MDLQPLVYVFQRAKEAALAAEPGEDGGTCNCDTPGFRLPKVRVSTIQKVAAAAGLTVTPYESWGARAFWLNVPLNGQGERRSRMMQAAQNVLSEFADSGAIPGFTACGYYQMD